MSALQLGDAGLPTAQVQLRAHTGRPRRSGKRQAITKDFSLGMDGPGYHLQPCWSCYHSQLSAQEEGDLVSEELEKRLKECEQTNILSSLG